MENREKFGSRLGFILISAGCAIGLGNVYRFPIMTGAYGGALFVLIYLAFLVLLGLPVMTCELAVGRGSQRSIASSFDTLERKGQKWHIWKYFGVAGNYLLMMFYTCVTSWFFVYFWKYLTGGIMQYKTSEELGGVFVGMITNPGLVIAVTVLVCALGFLVCGIGLQKGVERITKVLMVALFILMLGLAVYSLTLSGAGAGLKFYLVPSAANIRQYGIWEVISGAMGQAFFTLSLGIGSIAIFGSYIGKDRSLTGESITIIILDTFVALMSGFIIFPAFFTFNPGATGIAADQAGAGFLFITLSSIFNNMTVGRVVGTLFFIFMIFAAMSTVIAVFENIISFWLELTKVGRKKACIINFVLLVVLTLPAILGMSVWDKVTIFGRSIDGIEDYIVSNLMLPIGSLIYCVFCTSRFGWGWEQYELEINSGKGVKLGRWVRPYMTYILPLIIIVVLVMQMIQL